MVRIVKDIMQFKILTLKAPKGAKYKDIKLKFEVIEDINLFVQKLLKKQEIIYATKVAPVEYIVCQQNNKLIITHCTTEYKNRLYNITETKNHANVGDFIIIKNAWLPRKYSMNINTALKRYSFNPKEKQGVALPIARTERFVKVNKNIVFVSPWGETMCLTKGGYLNITGHRYYAIQGYAFDVTYKTLQQP